MGLQRRTFLGMITGFAGAILSAPCVFSWPLRWRKVAGGEDSAPDGPAVEKRADDASGIKITTIRRTTLRDTTEDLSREPEVFYIRGDWRRWERSRSYSEHTKPDGSSQRIYGPRTVTIVRPDRAKMFELNLDASEYAESPWPPKKPQPLTKEQMAARGITMPPPAASTKPTFQIQTTTKDTGERKEIFGYLARHVITSRKEIPLEGSRRSPQETVTDAWYVDLDRWLYPTIYPQDLGDSKRPLRGGHAYVSVLSSRSQGPPEIPEFVDIGEPETGFAVQEIRTSWDSFTMPDGSTRKTEGESEKVVKLERGAYTTALFEIPIKFKRVDHIEPNPILG
ncbi:MAG TPA: hypothetical protein VHS29_00465 [Candidatus Acidoferrales bacterium]|jgi:hypothetical protein|nr:hypothetical protein [Candidatus Acidoferrales bacterium]